MKFWIIIRYKLFLVDQNSFFRTYGSAPLFHRSRSQNKSFYEWFFLILHTEKIIGKNDLFWLRERWNRVVLTDLIILFQTNSLGLKLIILHVIVYNIYLTGPYFFSVISAGRPISVKMWNEWALKWRALIGSCPSIKNKHKDEIKHPGKEFP